MSQKEEPDTSIASSSVSQSDSESNIPTGATYNSMSDLPVEDNKNICCTSEHDGHRLMDIVVPINIDQLFILLFTNSKFYIDFQAARHTTNIKQTDWTNNPIDSSKHRIVTSNVELHSHVGPKLSHVTEKQVLLPCSKPGHLYSIDVDTVNAGVPYADSFVVSTHYCLHKILETSSSLSVYAEIKYTETLWELTKIMIDKNCFSGLEDYSNHLARALEAEGKSDSIAESTKIITSKKREHSFVSTDTSEDSRNVLKHLEGISGIELHTLISFSIIVLLLLLFSNVILHYKLWSLGETTTPTLSDLNLLKHSTKKHDDRFQSNQQQEALHFLEAQKCQGLLKNALKLLREAEEYLKAVEYSIHTNYLHTTNHEKHRGKNCVQCKEMYGPYFQGRACGDACLVSNGEQTPDCNNPGTLGKFLKRLY